ncbi:GH18963 [Drosophila grimshawi]|uniref:GH18963 n=1 Tax=Drosophila grimshawi TaxID=7222 RepID=B4JHH6_DROGR|nr:GH18963 [Drosophila grimshawi]
MLLLATWGRASGRRAVAKHTKPKYELSGKPVTGGSGSGPTDCDWRSAVNEVLNGKMWRCTKSSKTSSESSLRPHVGNTHAAQLLEFWRQ